MYHATWTTDTKPEEPWDATQCVLLYCFKWLNCVPLERLRKDVCTFLEKGKNSSSGLKCVQLRTDSKGIDSPLVLY
jgi:hypothetical protein